MFSETDCLSSEILMAYAENRLEADEKYLVENHLLDCSLCADALEGISALKDKSKLKPALEDISKRIDTYSKNRTPKVISFNFKMRMLAAAVVVALVGITFLLRNLMVSQNKEIVAERRVSESPIQKLDKDIEENSTVSDMTEEGEKGKTNLPGQEKQSVSMNSPTNQELKEAELEQAKYWGDGNGATGVASGENQQTFAAYYRNQNGTDDVPTSTVTAGLVISKDNETLADELNKEDVAADKSVVAEESDMRSEVQTVSTSDYKNISEKATTKSEASKKEKSVEAPVAVSGNSQVYTDAIYDQRYSDGIQFYHKADYSGCISQMQSYLNDSPDDINAYYYYGVSQYFLYQYDEAINSLQKVVKDKKNSFCETAQWYLSLSYIASNKITDAEKVLKDIVKAKGSFKVQAEDKLLEIEKQ